MDGSWQRILDTPFLERDEYRHMSLGLITPDRVMVGSRNIRMTS
jgi:hypothetical protein